MSATEKLSTPLAIDTKLAELYYEGQKLQNAVAYAAESLKHAAGAEYYYRGRSRVTNMTTDEAICKIEERLANPVDEHQLRLGRGFYTMDDARADLAKFEAAVAARDAHLVAQNDVEALYTGWNRFFLVTSSTGHIHSDMHCSTCRRTTTYGWLPQLSGKDEAQAVEQCGPALCSVCFPSAPTEHQMAKLSKKQVEDILAGKTITQEPKKDVCEGSGRYLNRELPHRTGFYSGNWATCEHCHQHAGVTSTGKIRAHKPKAA